MRPTTGEALAAIVFWAVLGLAMFYFATGG